MRRIVVTVMLPLLAPLFPGPWATYAHPVRRAAVPAAGAVPVAALLASPDRLADALARHADHLGVTGPDRRAVASAWGLAYVGALLPAAAMAATVLQHRLPVGPDDLHVTIDGHGTPVAFDLPHDGDPMPGTPTAVRYGPLLWDHLAPLFDGLHRQTRVAPKILWGNAVRYLQAVLDLAAGVGASPATLQADRDLLLHQAEWPDGRPNPMFATDRCAPGSSVRLHRQCCLYYLLPGQGYCGPCPLAPQHRAA